MFTKKEITFLEKKFSAHFDAHGKCHSLIYKGAHMVEKVDGTWKLDEYCKEILDKYVCRATMMCKGEIQSIREWDCVPDLTEAFRKIGRMVDEEQQKDNDIGTIIVKYNNQAFSINVS
ncbi:hypothetical protein KAR91_54835 [Candidatus Pacearchaeota archaeon]|nr:hypothetical protein [Candidatus Pacearchaeota archaeon]